LLFGQCFREHQGQQNENADEAHLQNERDDGRCASLGLQLAPGFHQTVFKHGVFSVELVSTPYLDTRLPAFAPKNNTAAGNRVLRQLRTFPTLLPDGS
jgi:hypothetical protein